MQLANPIDGTIDKWTERKHDVVIAFSTAMSRIRQMGRLADWPQLAITGVTLSPSKPIRIRRQGCIRADIQVP